MTESPHPLFRCQRYHAWLSMPACEGNRADSKRINCKDCEDWHYPHWQLPGNIRPSEFLSPPGATVAPRTTKEATVGKILKECIVCHETKADEGHGRCSFCRYWHKKGLSDDAILARLAAKKRGEKLPQVHEKRTPKPAANGAIVTLDFSDRPALLKLLQETAFQQIRSVEGQIMWELLGKRGEWQGLGE